MKKIMFVLILILINNFVFSQSDAMQFLSMGFNAVEDYRGDTSYYFYGYDEYSEALINFYIGLSTEKPGTFYPNGNIIHGFPPSEYRSYSGQNNSVGYYWYIPTQGTYGEEHKFENGRLVYWALTEMWNEFEGGPYIATEKIEQNAQGIIIYNSDGIRIRRYYNASKTEVLDQFLTKYLELICTINELVNESGLEHDLIITILQGRTARELAIFRNCLFAIKGYRFANSTWTEFFNKHLKNYKAQHSNAEVAAMFTENEKWLLDIVLQFEKRR